ARAARGGRLIGDGVEHDGGDAPARDGVAGGQTQRLHALHVLDVSAVAFVFEDDPGEDEFFFGRARGGLGGRGGAIAAVPPRGTLADEDVAVLQKSVAVGVARPRGRRSRGARRRRGGA